MLDEARRWFEASTVICRFVPEGKQRAEKVRKDVFIFVVWFVRSIVADVHIAAD